MVRLAGPITWIFQQNQTNELWNVWWIPFLDKAAVKDGNSSKPPCTVTQVEGTKLVLGMLLIWLVTLIPSIIWAQINTLFVKQGTTMDRSLGSSFQIPAASLGSFVTFSMLLSVPMYDRYFVPFMRRKTGNPRGITLLQRLGIGFVIQITAIAIAYAVEVRRMHAIRVHHIMGPKETVPMSIFCLLPQYVLLGIADVFNAIGLLEFFYDQSPEDMQSLGTTFFTSGIGVGNFLNSFLVTVVDKITGRGNGESWIGDNLNDSHLNYYYGFLLVISTLNLGAFLWASSKYVYKRETIEFNEGCIELESKALEISPLGLQV
ncbi:protein NRT1/PTR FAMILY 5.1-like [Gossypium australe]|uniref:Protein NRT1/PTR FAMILY 5.1-like n=1 Tax=Gossypium australe TaxID=47621 RepID=A0A5B6WHW9_9ROSI|nr:protein NRT1/PTR FAMILY 5.1-like [Gossypium australe]